MKEIKNREQLNQLLSGNKPVLLDFYADWCGPCQTLLPIVSSFATKYDDKIEIVKINIDKLQDIATDFKVRSIPSLFFIKDKQVQENIVGLQGARYLEDKINYYAG